MTMGMSYYLTIFKELGVPSPIKPQNKKISSPYQ